jgi:hypothetical protein
MQHVRHIKDLIERGESSAASQAIDNLLVLGPKNLEAHKLKALIHRQHLEYDHEAACWNKIAEIDGEDEDLIEYHLQKQLEDREKFYFSDGTANQGRRYLAYPQAMMHASLLGIMGSLGFFTFSRTVNAVSMEWVLFLFGLGVIAPWIWILHVWASSLKSVTIDQQGISVEKRFRHLSFNWQDLKEVTVVFQDTDFYLVLKPFRPEQPSVIVDLSQSGSALRARRSFLAELREHCRYLKIRSIMSQGALPDKAVRV